MRESVEHVGEYTWWTLRKWFVKLGEAGDWGKIEVASPERPARLDDGVDQENC